MGLNAVPTATVVLPRQWHPKKVTRASVERVGEIEGAMEAREIFNRDGGSRS